MSLEKFSIRLFKKSFYLLPNWHTGPSFVLPKEIKRVLTGSLVFQIF